MTIFENPSIFQIQYSRPLFFQDIQYWAEKNLLNQTLINHNACILLNEYSRLPISSIGLISSPGWQNQKT